MQTQTASEELGATGGVPLSHYFRALGRWWWVITCCAVLGVAAGFGYWWLAPTKVTATSTVSVNVISTDPFSSSRPASTLLDGAAEAQIAGSYIVAEAAAKETGGKFTAEQIRDSLDIQSVVDTTVLRISSTMPTAKDASTTADAVADAYLAYRSKQADERIASSVAQSDQRLQSLREELRTVNEKLNAAKAGSAAATDAETDRALLNLEISSLLSQSASTKNIDTTGGSILNPASRSTMIYEPKQGLIAIAGLLGGLGIGVILAFILNALDSRVRSEEDIRTATGRPVLGRLSSRVPGIPATGSDLLEVRAIRERMFADARFTGATGVCAVIDAGAEEISDIPVNLAFAFARSGVAVEFLSSGASDEFMSSLLDAFDLEVVADDDSGTRLTSKTLPTFSVYFANPASSDTDGDYLAAAVQAEIQSRSQDALIFLSIPSNTALASRLTVNRLSDTTVTVAAVGETRSKDLKGIAQDAERAGSHLLGTIIVEQHRRVRTDNERVEGEVGKDVPVELARESI